MRKMAALSPSSALAGGSTGAGQTSQSQDFTLGAGRIRSFPPARSGRIRSKASGGDQATIFPPSSSARRSTITTWRGTASPASPTSIPATSPAASIVSLGQVPFIFADGHKRGAGLRRLVSQIRRCRDEGHQCCFGFIHDPGGFHSRTKEGRRARRHQGHERSVRRSRQSARWWRCSAAPTCRPQIESRDAIERGVADAITFPWGSMFLFGIDKVTKYHIDAPLYTTVFTYSMNKAVYDGMSAAQKKVIDDHCTGEWAEKVAGPGPISRPPAARR